MTIPLNILFVEDSPQDMELMLLELRRSEWNLTHFRVDTAQAMSVALGAMAWDLIIADYTLPSFSGADALALARNLVPGCPFILVSGTVGDEIATAAMKAGANDYLFKGNLKRLNPVIKRELGRAHVCTP